MPDKSKNSHDPLGFTPRSGRRTSELAREQGWQMNEEERKKTPDEKQPYDGGTDYDYGAKDFGDSPVNTSAAKPPKEAAKAKNSTPQKKPKKKTA